MLNFTIHDTFLVLYEKLESEKQKAKSKRKFEAKRNPLQNKPATGI